MPTALNDLLQATSRSFYLTLRVLPARVRPQIGLAYLLARTTDTIADTELVPPAQRLDALQKLRERILGQNSAPLNFGELAKQQGSAAERLLLDKVKDALALLQTLSPEDLKLVRAVLITITGGQELDLRRFANSSAEKIIALETAAELDDYTYRVAGCVGEFWTKICLSHQFSTLKIPGFEPLSETFFEELGVQFGKGLQLVNILRDLPKDLRNGRCYLPAEKLAEAGLVPEDLLRPANEGKFRPLYNHYLDLAESHLAAGWQYTNLVPRGQMRVRLACAWPVLIGAKTISRLREGNILDPQRRIKITRGEVRGILLRSVASYPFPGAWQKLFSQAGKQLHRTRS